jgi:hypothetical protein
LKDPNLGFDVAKWYVEELLLVVPHISEASQTTGSSENINGLRLYAEPES